MNQGLVKALEALLKKHEEINYAFYVSGTRKVVLAAMKGQKELMQQAREVLAKNTEEVKS